MLMIQATALADGSDDDDQEDENDQPDTELRVQEALQTLRNTANEVTITDLPTDKMEKQFLSQFAATGTKAKGKSCSTRFSSEEVKSVQAACAELSRWAWHGDSFSRC